jgi:DNA-binding transcriptional MerR regulator
MRIGEVSTESGVPVGTIRFYERRKLLKSPPRSASGYRCFAPQDVQIVKAIKQMQGLGFTLKEIKELLDLHRTAACLSPNRARPGGNREMIVLTQEKLQNIEKKIQLLRQMHKDVANMLGRLQTQPEKACPVARELSSAQLARKC